MKSITTVFLLLLSVSSFGQDLAALEHNLLAKFQRIRYWHSFSSDDDKINSIDSLEKANLTFQKALLPFTGREPATLSYVFQQLQDSGLTIATSADHRFRIYSWDTEEGGTMHFFSSVYQYQTEQGVFSKTFQDSADEGDPGAWSTPVYTLRLPTKTYYLAINHTIFSNLDIHQAIQAFSIDKRALNDSVRLFKTKTGLKNKISFDFNFFSAMKDHEERPIQLITFDPVKKEVHIPIVLENGSVTRKFLSYRWTGTCFERQ